MATSIDQNNPKHLKRPMTIASRFLIAFIVLVGFLLLAFLIVPVSYYGNMLLVVALKLKPKQGDIPGNYSVSTDWGVARLNIRQDHTFTEIVTSPKFGDQSTTGTWAFDKEISSQVGLSTTFKPFIEILHDKPEKFSYGTEDFNVNVIGMISNEQDPDFGISFYKDRH